METVPVVQSAPLSQAERVVDIFVAPARTFTDIRRSASWWLPIVIVMVLSTFFSYTVLHKVGVPSLVDSTIRSSPALEDRMTNATPEAAAAMRGSIQKQFQFMYLFPVLSVLAGLLVAGILLGTANFVFAGSATYGQMLAVWFYGTLPLSLVSVITALTLYAGMSTDAFNIKNPIGTNIGFYLQGSSIPPWLVTLLSSVDIFAIWTAIVLSIGVSVVAGVKRSSGAVVVFGWWALYVLIQTGFAAVSG
jgi:hypothetical protein